MFKNRIAAGEMLAERLEHLQGESVCILAVPRGGIIVAQPVAQKLQSKIQVLVTRKVGHPANPEVAIGAVMPDGSGVGDSHIIESLGIGKEDFAQLVAQEYQEVQRRQLLYTGSTEAPNVKGKTAIIIDDGIATGYTIYAAIKWLQQEKPLKIIVAVPVAPPDTVMNLAKEVDEIICLLQPKPFRAVGMHYEDFSQNTDEEVTGILHATNSR